MRELLSFITDGLTEPLGLPLEWYWEWTILVAIGVAAYIIAYRVVGVLYSRGRIDGRVAGSILHWVIRLIAFIVIWAITYGIIWLVRFITAHWVIVLCALGGAILIAAAICIILRLMLKPLIYRKMRKEK